MGILSGLNRKKKIEQVFLSVEILVLKLLKENLKNFSTKNLNPEIEILKVENFQIDFVKEHKGFVLQYFNESIKAPLVIYIPVDFISQYIPLKYRVDPEIELLKLFSHIPEHLLSTIDQNSNFTFSSGEKPGLLNYIGSNLMSVDGFLWNISSYIIIQIKIESFSSYLFMEEKKFSMFNKNCKEYEVLLDSINSSNQKYTSQNEFNNKFKVTGNEAEFLIGRFFLPRIIQLGEHNAVSGIESVTYEPEFANNETGVNFVLNLSINNEIYNINFFITSKIESKDYITSMIKALVKAVLPMWRKYFEIQKVGGSKSFPVDAKIEYLFSGGIKYKNSLIPVEIGLSKGIISLLYKRYVDPIEKNPKDISNVISINQALLHIFLEGNLFLPLSLSEFINILDEADLRRIIQNFFSGTGWKGGEIQKLFTYSKKDIQKKKIYYFQDPSFNRTRFLIYLPKAQKDEWNISRSASESSKEMISSGRNALRDIYHSYKNDHLELSFKGAMLLKQEFKIQGDKKIKRELDLLIDKEPFSILLEGTFPRDVQNLLAKLTAKILANAVVLYPGSLENFKIFMSHNYHVEVKDLVQIIQRKSTIDGFYMEDIKTDVYAVHDGLKSLSKEVN